MKRSATIGLCVGVIAFVSTDFVLYTLALWLAGTEAHVTSAVAGQFLLPFFPVVLAGLASGYLAAPHGFVVGFLACLTGAIVSLAWHYQAFLESVLQDRVNSAAMFSWVAGTAMVGGVCGWAGERLRAKHSREA